MVNSWKGSIRGCHSTRGLVHVICDYTKTESTELNSLLQPWAQLRLPSMSLDTTENHYMNTIIIISYMYMYAKYDMAIDL